MIYPDGFEQKIGFGDVRALLREQCLSPLGRERVDSMSFCKDAETVNVWLCQVREFRRLVVSHDDFPLQFFFDVREAVMRLRVAGTHLDESELFDVRRSLETIDRIVAFLQRESSLQTSRVGEDYEFPALQRLTVGVATFPGLLKRIDLILDKFGRIKDTASTGLAAIRQDLKKAEGSVSRTLYAILRSAQRDGVVEKDVSPMIRDGRLVIPVVPAMKRRIPGIVYDESASGKTVFVEPTEVVEANNRIRELEREERREIIRILTAFSDEVRPHVEDMLGAYDFLGLIDFIRAKARVAEDIGGYEPVVARHPEIDWTGAVHPLLRQSLERQGRQVVPLDVTLTRDRHILIISGPNAGGKSVCLKTVGLLQYMLQCGLSIPVGERSQMGVFDDIMIDIGDEQSLENDLSTYSSHLLNMKIMMKHSSKNSLLLIDELGTGTEPAIGGAIAESVLGQFCRNGAFAIVTTHYQNLKHFAEDHDGVTNGAMLYDRHEMQPLFQLAIGQPGSSFAVEIARKIGLPEAVIREASEIVGSDYIQSDKYLQDIVRDKRYWEGKRQSVHQREKDLERIIARYEADIAELEKSRKDILQKAKEQAEELLRESNRRIENVIREIREQQAEREATKRIREELEMFKHDVSDVDATASDEMIARKMAQIQARKERKEKRKKEKANANINIRGNDNGNVSVNREKAQIQVGDQVRIVGLTSVGLVETVNGNMVTVAFGDMHTRMRAERLEKVDDSRNTNDNTNENRKQALQAVSFSRMTRETIDERRRNFKSDLDVRGMRGDEALNAVQYFIDDAILMGMSRVRILHGKGNGILRQLIRQYLSAVPNVSHYADEHVQFGGAGITVVDL